MANPAGEMMFDGTVDAGTLKIEVVHGNKDLVSGRPYCRTIIPSDKAFSVDGTEVLITL